jgi:hypothetical protein
MRAALIPLVLLAAMTMAGAARKPAPDPTPATQAATASASASRPAGAPAAAALPTSINDTGLRGQLSPGAKTIPTTLFAHAFAPVPATRANTPAPVAGRKISLHPLLAQSDPQVCRSSCARSYYVCLANDQTGYCPSDWSRCLSTCGVAGGAGTLPPLAPPR